MIYGINLNFKFMKKIILILFILIIISCGKEKTEFIKSKAIGNLFLLKNPPREDSLVKKIIINFLVKNPPKYTSMLGGTSFYKYTSDTKYFLNNKEDDPTGLSLGEEQLSFYVDDQIAYFSFIKCKNDTSQIVGRLHFYGTNNMLSQIDTIIHKCK